MTSSPSEVPSGSGRTRTARRRRRWWRRRALPPSRRAQAIGGLLALVVLALLLLGISRTRPGRDVPDYVPHSVTELPVLTSRSTPQGELLLDGIQRTAQDAIGGATRKKVIAGAVAEVSRLGKERIVLRGAQVHHRCGRGGVASA